MLEILLQEHGGKVLVQGGQEGYHHVLVPVLNLTGRLLRRHLFGLNLHRLLLGDLKLGIGAAVVYGHIDLVHILCGRRNSG